MISAMSRAGEPLAREASARMHHRLFIGLRPPEEIRDNLIDLMDGIDGARWQDDDQLHVTLRYVGEVERVLAEDLADSLSALEFEPFALALADTGIFQRKGRPHTLWAGVKPNEALMAFQRKIERRCVRIGLPPETRKFHPHVTIARLNASTGPVAPFLARTAGIQLGEWCVNSYILYESHLRTGGSLYEPVIRYPIAT